MWIAIIAIASLLLAATVSAPKPEVEDARWRGLGDNAFPTSKYGDAVPMVFGTCEQKSPIVLWYGKFQPLANYTEQRTGLFSSTLVIESYRYLIGFDLGICLGPGVVLEQIKKEGGAVVWDGRGGNEEGGVGVDFANISIQGFLDIGGGLEFFPGNFDQSVSPFISTPSTQGGAHFQSGAAVESYSGMPGICHIVFVQFYIGDDNPVPPRFTFVVKNLSNNLGGSHTTMSNNQDINPIEIVYTVLTQKWGCLGIDPALIDTDNFLAAASTLHSEGLGMALVVSQEQEAKKVIEECMRVADGILYQDPVDEKFKVTLVRDDYTVGDLLVLDESNIVSDLENYSRTTWEQTFNQVRVTYQSRENAYQSQVVLVQDQGNIKYTGSVRTKTITFPGVKDDAVARALAVRELEFLSSPILKCSVTANRQARELRPGSLFLLNWGPYGITNAVMRVVKISFGTLTDNGIVIDAVQDKYAKDLISFEFPVASSHVAIDLGAPETTEFKIFDPPLFLISDTDEITDDVLTTYESVYKPMVLAKAPNEHCVGFDFLLAPDEMPDKFKPVIVNQPYIGMGKLEAYWDSSSAANGAFSGHTASAGLIVYGLTSDEIDNLVDNPTFDDARDGSSLFLIKSELICYVGFTDLGGGRVRFDNLYRGMLNTDSPSFNATLYALDSEVWFIRRGSGVSESSELPLTYQNLNYKIATRTPIGVLDHTTITEDTALIQTAQQARPLPPKGISFNSVARSEFSPYFDDGFTLSWKERSRKDYQMYSHTEDADSGYFETGITYEVKMIGDKSSVSSLETTTTSGTSVYIDIDNFDDGQVLIGQVSAKLPNNVSSIPTRFEVST